MPRNKKEAFRRVASKRVRNILEKITILSNCSNTYHYKYSQEEVHKMFSTLKNQLHKTETLFKNNLEKDKKAFTFTEEQTKEEPDLRSKNTNLKTQP